MVGRQSLTAGAFSLSTSRTSFQNHAMISAAQPSRRCQRPARQSYATQFDDDYDPSYDLFDDGDNEDDNNIIVDRLPIKETDQTTSHFFSKKSLSDPSFQADEVFEQLCEGIGISKPSKIQSLAWPVLRSGQHAILAEQTGSGKVRFIEVNYQKLTNGRYVVLLYSLSLIFRRLPISSLCFARH